MANKRTYWAVEGLATGIHGAVGIANAQFCPGVQSVGITTNFNLEQIFQLGQLEIYQDLEEVPDVEITVERTIDQFVLLYGRAMHHADAGNITISGDQNNQVDIFFAITNDQKEVIGSDLDAFAYCSGMFCSSASFNFDTDGFFTESISLVGNHKAWTTADDAGVFPAGSPVIGNLDTGDVAKRQKFAFIGTEADAAVIAIPAPLNGLTATAVNSTNTVAVSNVSVSVDFGREEINILGKRMPYHRYVTFPVEVTCDIEAYVTDIDNMAVDAKPEVDNTTEQPIRFGVFDTSSVHVEEGAGLRLHTFNLGIKNRLQSVTWNGVDTGGTNATITYSYRNFNKLDYAFKDSAVATADAAFN
tara:strand:- start:1361 stop:2437 length:1077 start_codon:yes stop_codon:yes gene_type:complete